MSKNYLIRFKKNNINYSGLVKDKKVLITGSGPGREIILLNSFNPEKLYAVDLSPKNVKLGKEIIKKYSFDKKKNFVKKQILKNCHLKMIFLIMFFHMV